MRVAIIANPSSGKGKAAAAAKYLERLMQRRGITPAMHYTSSVSRTKKLANHISFRYPKVIAVGGDGTINEIINGIIGTDCKLGIVPTGTANVLALELGLPRDIEKASAIAVNGNAKRIDLGKVNSRYFSLMCGIGLDAEVISQVKPLVKEIFRKAAFPMVAVKTLINYQPEHLSVKIDDSLMSEGYFVVVANSHYYGGTMSIARKADLADGILDVCIFKTKSNIDFLRHIAALVIGKNISAKGVEFYKAKDVKVVSDNKPVLIQADGDVVDKTPADISIQPKKIQVMVQHS